MGLNIVRGCASTFGFFLCLVACDAVYGGRTARRGDYPKSMAHFGVADDESGWVCGGVLITWRHVLTAAHCEVTVGRSMVYVGSPSLHDHDRSPAFQIKSVHTHPKYRRDSADNDLQIVTLHKRARHDLKRLGVRPIDIEWNASELPVGTIFRIMGFGGAEEIEDAPSQKRLRVGDTYSTNNEECLDKFKISSRRSVSICFDGRRSSACSGDSGGPVVHRGFRTGRWTLVGIVSSGENIEESCKRGEKWNAVNVEKHRKWVESIVGRHTPRQWRRVE